MARKPNKTKSKRSTAKSKAKRNGSKALMAQAASVRTGKLNTRMSGAPSGKPTTSLFNPALTMIAMTGRVMGAYAELPARLSRCRSPLDIWFEQARFVQHLFSESTVPAGRLSLALRSLRLWS